MKYIKTNMEFKSEEHIKAWLLKVTINCSKNFLASAWFRRTTALENNIYADMEEKTDVYKYVLKLSSKYRVVIHLFYYEDLPTIEIAEILNIKEATVRSQLHRARKILRENMKGDEDFEF